MVRILLVTAAAVGAAACDYSSSEDAADAGSVDSHAGDGGVCEGLPEAMPDWFVPSLQTDIAALSGGAAIDGVSLPDRATVERRALTRRYLQGRWGEQGLVAFDHSYGTGANVYAELTADAPPDPDRVESIVVGAHFDTVSGSPGANDNATGVAAVLAVARALAKTSCRGRSFIFVHLDQEEIGLVGSAAFAEYLVGQQRAVHSVHTVDQIGWDQDGNRGLEIEQPDGALSSTYLEVASALAIPIAETSVNTTDHEAFRQRGFVAVGLTEEFLGGDTTPHYHQPSDTFETVDVAFTASSAWYWASVLATVAAEPAGKNSSLR